MKTFQTLAIRQPEQLRFGIAPKPLITRRGMTIGGVKIPQRETAWLDTIEEAVSALPAKASAFIDQMMGTVDTTKFVARDYELA